MGLEALEPQAASVPVVRDSWVLPLLHLTQHTPEDLLLGAQPRLSQVIVRVPGQGMRKEVQGLARGEESSGLSTSQNLDCQSQAVAAECLG